MSNRSGGPGPPLFSVFCFSKRPPARHPEVARPPTDPEIKKRRPTYTPVNVYGVSNPPRALSSRWDDQGPARALRLRRACPAMDQASPPLADG